MNHTLKMRERLFAFCCLQILISACFAQGDEKRGPAEEPTVTAYTKAFAKRFGLPDPPPDLELKTEVEALEFRVESGRKQGTAFRCKLRVYLRSGLPIEYPQGGTSASRDPATLTEHFFFHQNENNKRWLSLSVEDRVHFSAQDNFRRSAALATPDLNMPARGFWGGLIYDQFYRELFPKIDYIRFDSHCGPFADAPDNREVQLWIKRIGAKDYRYSVFSDPADFMKFGIPPRFLAEARRWAKAADAKNRSLVTPKKE